MKADEEINMLIRIGVLALSIMISTVACAMTQVSFTTADMLDNAEHVVLARCSRVQFDTGQGVFLGKAGYFYFDIEEVIKGAPPLRNSELVLRLGGVTAPNAPFVAGERVVLFLGKKNQDGYPTLYGSQNTVLRVIEAAREFPHPALQGQHQWVIKNGVTGIAGAPADPAAAKAISLDAFLTEARARVAASKRSGQ
ncbi:MAG: hypothetical protein FD165_1869 [Gammaproteobacteria bacterium]|nr:MAG: hypothetical protein FD165_1869 [Gammaproteobacteria bacterium]TND04442.1 MAG: hypothetical protein FD120_1556 [Gammaproteobacteria bacterium]